MRRSLGVLLVLLSACSSSEPAAQPEKQQDSSAAKTEVEGIDASKPAEKLDAVEPAEPVEPVATNPASAVIQAGVEAPSKPALLAVLEPVIAGDLALLAPIVEFGPRRFAAAIRSQPDAAKPVFEVHAVIVEASEATPPVWSVVASLEIHEVDGSAFDDTVNGEASSIPTTALADDWDDDGEPELLVRVRNWVMCPADKGNEITTMVIVDATPTLNIALETELHHTHSMGMQETKATPSHEDLNGDGHRDLRIEYATTSTPLDDDGEPETEVAENRWLWESGRDAWALENGASGKPGYVGWGCDW